MGLGSSERVPNVSNKDDVWVTFEALVCGRSVSRNELALEITE